MWRDDWPEFSGTEAVVTVAAGAGTAALVLLGPAKRARWQGGVLFDDAARDALRADSKQTRASFQNVGDATYYAAPLLPVLDIVVVSLLVNRDGKTARNLTLLSLEAFAISGFLSFVSTTSTARARPDSECSTEPCYADTQSFWSGHSAIAATGAGLVCANHLHMPLWGHPVADAAACTLASAGALLTATTRVIADRHYASDVLVGTGVGFTVGFAVPTLLHYSVALPADLALTSDPACGSACIALQGRF